MIIPELRKHGGAERLLIECLTRWQHEHDITVYAAVFNYELLAQAGITNVSTRLISPQFAGEHATLLNATILPKMWEAEIGHHDIYHAHLWPTHLVDLHPMVWYPHEPLRILHDLKYAHVPDDEIASMQRKLHFYPKETYDTVEGNYYHSLFRVIDAIDLTGRPDRIVANSQYTARYLENVYNRPVSDVVYPGVTTEEMLDLPGDRNMVLTIGQLWPHKRMRVIIEAIAEVEGVQLYIVGNGPEKERLQRLCQRMGVDDRVFFIGGLDNHEVQILLGRCLCVVFAPVREPFGIVALEALAAGKPLVAAEEGGYVEVVDKDCAILVKPQPSALANAIRELHQNPAMAARMGRHGREVAAGYSWGRTASELLAIIEDTHSQWLVEHRPRHDTGGPIIAIHYFNWYGEGLGSAHWCDNQSSGWVSDVPTLGYYSSMSGDTIREHLNLIEQAEIDVVVFNLHVDETGLNIYQHSAAQRMQSIAEETGSSVRFLVNLCPYTQDVDVLRQAASVLADTLVSKDNYLTHDGKPVIQLFWSGTFDRDYAFIDAMRDLFRDYLRIGAFMRPAASGGEHRHTRGLFHAISQFSPLELGERQNWHQIWDREYEASGQESGLKCVTVSPGYDDSDLNDSARLSGVRVVSREDGVTYQNSLDYALSKPSPAFVFITSFNEFHENSHIEPTRKFGSLYMDMTRSFVRDARKRWATADKGDNADAG